MPLTRLSLSRGQYALYGQRILHCLEQALTDIFQVDPKDQLVIIHDHTPDQFFVNNKPREAFLLIQITANNTRTNEQKQALFACLSELLVKNAAMRAEDIFINLIEVPQENWAVENTN